MYRRLIDRKSMKITAVHAWFDKNVWKASGHVPNSEWTGIEGDFKTFLFSSHSKCLTVTTLCAKVKVCKNFLLQYIFRQRCHVVVFRKVGYSSLGVADFRIHSSLSRSSSRNGQVKVNYLNPSMRLS